MSYNTFELTAAAIRTALEAARELRHEVIVVDNASPDESGPRLKAAFAGENRVRILEEPVNSGFSAANNRGASEAAGEILFFLNPDTVVHDDAIFKLVSFIREHPEAGAVGPRVLNGDGSLQHSAMEFPTPRSIVRHHLPIASLLAGSDRRLDPLPSDVQEIDIVKGCALAVTRRAFEDVGEWDESYFMYSEETELCYALRAKGYINYYFAEAVVTHFGGAASAERYAEEQIRVAESAVGFLRRHNPPSHRILYRVTGLVGYAVRVILFTLLIWRRPGGRTEYSRRRSAALALTRWFAIGRD